MGKIQAYSFENNIGFPVVSLIFAIPGMGSAGLRQGHRQMLEKNNITIQTKTVFSTVPCMFLILEAPLRPCWTLKRSQKLPPKDTSCALSGSPPGSLAGTHLKSSATCNAPLFFRISNLQARGGLRITGNPHKKKTKKKTVHLSNHLLRKPRHFPYQS